MNKNNLEKERELLELAKSDKSKFDELYKYFLNDVYRFSYSLLNNKEEAEDLTSKVFMKFYQNIDKYEWRDISLKNWLFRTARNFAYETFRKPVLESYEENLDIGDETEISFVDEIINLELVEQVKEEIQKLNPIEQELINLRIWEGMQFDEIAQIQGSSMETTKKRFYRSIEKIKKTLDSKGIRSLLALPLLFTALKQVGSTPAYAASVSLSGSRFENGILIKNKIMEPINKTNKFTAFFTSKVGIASVVLATIIVSASAGAFLYQSNKPRNNEAKSSNAFERRTDSSIKSLKLYYFGEYPVGDEIYYEFTEEPVYSYNCSTDPQVCKRYVINKKNKQYSSWLAWLSLREEVRLTGNTSTFKAKEQIAEVTNDEIEYVEVLSGFSLGVKANYMRDFKSKDVMYYNFDVCAVDLPDSCLGVLIDKESTKNNSEYDNLRPNTPMLIFSTGEIKDTLSTGDSFGGYINLINDYRITELPLEAPEISNDWKTVDISSLDLTIKVPKAWIVETNDDTASCERFDTKDALKDPSVCKTSMPFTTVSIYPEGNIHEESPSITFMSLMTEFGGVCGPSGACGESVPSKVTMLGKEYDLKFITITNNRGITKYGPEFGYYTASALGKDSIWNKYTLFISVNTESQYQDVLKMLNSVEEK